MPEPTLRALLLVAGGGALGCALRYLVQVALARAGELPWGTLAVNLAGSLAIGLFLFWGGGEGAPPGEGARLLLATGLLGGFTTMSAFAFETVSLVAAAQPARAAAYVALTTLGSLLAAAAGRWLALQLA